LVTPASNTPPAGCQVGTGLANGALPLTLYLVQAPSTSDLAGLEIVAGGVNSGVGDVTSRTTDGGLDISFGTLPAGLSSLSTSFTGTDLRMPTNCPGENISAATNGQATPFSASPALTVTGCSGLAYNPQFSAQVIRDSGDTGAEVKSTITQTNASSESASKSVTLGFGTLSPNTVADLPCITGTPCTVGTASATSPLLPSAAFTGGTVTLGPPTTTPTLTITFPILHLSLAGTINLANNTVTFPALPDFPLSMLAVDVTGPNGQKAFTTDCSPSSVAGTFTPWSGNAAVHTSTPVAYTGCPTTTAGNPTASGSLSGLATGHPKLKFKVKHGSNAPNIGSVSVKPASGLKFKCVKSGKSCKGLSVTGGTLKSAKVSGGQLVIKLKKPAAAVTVKAKGPALSESSSLQSKVKKHKVKSVTFTLKVKDASGKTSTVKLKLKA
jgi:hypothetical protein